MLKKSKIERGVVGLRTWNLHERRVLLRALASTRRQPLLRQHLRRNLNCQNNCKNRSERENCSSNERQAKSERGALTSSNDTKFLHREPHNLNHSMVMRIEKNERVLSKNRVLIVTSLPGQLGFSNKSCLCSCSKKENSSFEGYDEPQGFSALSADIEWDYGSIWSSMSLYFFSVHVPLSFGGLSVIAEIMHQKVLDPQTKALSILLIQGVELWGTLALLRYTSKVDYKLVTIFEVHKNSKGRSWLQASVLGFGLLMLLVFLISFLADKLVGPKDVNNPMLKEILLSGTISRMACFLTYCAVTPLLEEIVYRGFLLTALASTTKWHHAVIISSCIFSVAHLSSENLVQLFVVGCVLGSSYCWSGNLTSSFFIHSLYNAVILIFTILS
ncbi:hypothetical protein Sjap_006450 [Stephania japonica]|uniref:CAAX prenyl protease 2/Lysostaphin resistance protein A-like domain-containing protein n=1 Tax=Stephania japonica TaxID=461633 RepID=A0AAP0K5X0_9MAGN